MRAHHTEARRLPSWKCPAAMILAKTDGSTILASFSQRFIENICWSSESQGAWYSEEECDGENTNRGGWVAEKLH